MTLLIRLLGQPEISHDDRPLPFKGRKALALLAYLLVTGQAHSRQHLVDLLYDEADDPRAGLRWDLNHLRQVIGSVYIEADREQVSFNFEGDYWLDLTAFAAGQTELYRGDFLAGLEVRGAQPFTEWLYFQRERLRGAYEQALLHRFEQSRQQGEYERLVELAQQLIQLDNLREEWHRALMQGYALLGKWEAALAQYDLCRQVLIKELQLEPDPETEALYRQIQARTVADPRPLAELSPRWPNFLAPDAADEASPIPLFVARERQLAQLERWLRQALAGQGQTVFVSGGPGQGKTSLLAEFARRAQATQPNLLVALGSGTAYTGQGDPYLPFKEMLEMLTGEVETRRSAGVISLEQARRLWANLLPATQALLEHGAYLLDTLIPQRDLLARLKIAAPERVDEVTHRLAQSCEVAATPLAQEHLFQQVTQLLRALARRAPLLLILDDLHWADASSLSLLFHLGRRLGNSPILLIGAYRPDEVSQRQGHEAQPLEKILVEFKRALGQVWLELDGLDETENRHFVDALLDAEPNQLGVAFRHTLYRSTAGQPLFTVELLHMMQERGDLRQNPQGYWVESDSLAWERLPARVEAVIGERLNRLEPELRQTLSIASMSGEEFIAQAVAIVQNLDERRWLSQLAQVERQYHLVRERGEAQAGDRILSRYQFAHTLFQRYLYESLSRAERRLLHGQVGAALERLYGDQSGEVAGQLAWHFQEAQRPGRACPYLRQAGEQAARQYANDEALAYFNRALELTPTEAQAERLTLLLAREQIYYLQGKRQAQQQDLAALQELAELLGDERQRTEVALRQAMCAAVISDHPLAITTAQTAISLAQATGDKQSEARGYRIWGTSLNQQGNYQAAQIQLNKALALAQAGRLRLVEADTLRSLSWVAYHLGDYRRATLYNEQALIIYRELGHRSGEAEALNNLGVHADQQAAYDLARAYYQQALTIQQEIGNIRGEAGTLGNLGLVCFHGGDYPAAEVHYTQALHIFSEIGDRLNEGLIRTNLGLLWHHWGDDEAARRYSQEALMIAQEVGNRNGQSFALTNLGHALTGLGHLTEAAEVYRQALAIRRELEQPNLAMETVAGLARVTLGQGNLPQSLAYIEQILNHLESHTLEGAEHPFQVYLTCYQVLLANQDARTTSFLTLAYRLLQEQAIKISDEAQRRSFLEQVTAHRELVEAFERNEF